MQWCRVTKGGRHPATHPRTGLCDLHHAEYEKARGAWRARVLYHRNHPGSPDPGPWEESAASIDYTAVDEVYTALDVEDRGILRNVAAKLEGVATVLPPFVTGDAYLTVKEEDFRVMAGHLQAAIADAVAVLRLHGEEPRPGRRSTSPDR